MLELAKQNVPSATLELADIVTWTTIQSFDGIIAWDSLFHLPPQDQVPVLEKLFNALKPNGAALVTFGGRAGEIRSTMLGREFYYGSLATDQYTDALNRIGFETILMSRDKTADGRIALLLKKAA